MDRTRIRWSNVGRLLGGVGAGGLLLVVVPGLIEPSDPPPLPADVGLATGATGAYVTAPATDHDRDRDHRASPDRDRRARPSSPRPPERARSPRPPERPPAQPSGEPAPAPAPPVPAPAPVTAPAAPAPPPEPPAEDEGDPAPEQHPPAPEPTPPPSPSQFGFEH
jgi:hypothetical protein